MNAAEIRKLIAEHDMDALDKLEQKVYASMDDDANDAMVPSARGGQDAGHPSLRGTSPGPLLWQVPFARLTLDQLRAVELTISYDPVYDELRLHG